MSTNTSHISNERMILALQNGRQLAFDWRILGDRLAFISDLPDSFGNVPLAGVNSSAELLTLVHPDDEALYMAEVRHMLREKAGSTGTIHHAEIRLKDHALGWLWVELFGRVVERDSNDQAVRVVGAFNDIMTRKLAEQRLARLRDMYAALSQTNQAILHIESKQALFHEICRIAVEHGRFQMALVRLLDRDTNLLETVAGHGKYLHLVDKLEVSIDPDKETGRGVSGSAVRESRPAICNDFFSMQFPQPWFEIATALGLNSFASFPFRQENDSVGVLILYAAEKNFFDQALISLLEDMTREIAFALDNLDHERQRIAVEAALADSVKLKDGILLAALDCIVSFDAGGNIIDFNPAAERTFGYQRQDALQQPFFDLLIGPQSRQQYGPAFAQLLDGGASPMRNRRIELTAMHREGMIFPAEIAVAPVTLHDRRIFTAYMRDISELKQSQAILKDSEARYRQLIDLSPEAIFVRQRGRFVLLNEACVRLFGANGIGDLLGREVVDFVHPDSREGAIARARQLPMGVEHHVHFMDEVWLRADGSSFNAEISANKFIYLGSSAVQVVIRDISARMLAEQLQLVQNRILKMIATGASLTDILTALQQFVDAQSGRGRCAIQLLNESGSALHAGVASNLPPAYLDTIARVPVGPAAASFGTAIHRHEPVVSADIGSDPLWAGLRAPALEHGLRACASWPIEGKNKKMLGTLSLYYGETGAPSARDLQLVDISTNLAGIAIENKEAEDRIRFLAHYDEMTELPNRSLFNQMLAHGMEIARRANKKLAVLFVDLDRFKNINDTFGHVAGDQVLQEIADRMRTCLRKADTVARMGGDEFYILLEDLSEPDYASSVAQKILTETARPVYINQQECHLTASIGIAVFPDDGGDALTLLKNSDIAMYRAKSEGKNTYQYYSASSNMHTIGRMALESQLRRSIENREFVLHYQPKLELASGRITGVEALVRWQHPESGLLAPSHFIALAEETRLIIPLGKQILEMACRDACIINAAGRQAVRVAVNLSAQQFEDPDFLNDLHDLMLAGGVRADLMQLEITESMVMRNPTQAVRIMNELQRMGIRLDIDDFGTGYSSLAYLKRFPLYSLKIDRSFIQDIPYAPNDTAITLAIIAMGHSLGMRLVAEGVETAEQMEALREFGCDEIQGFYFSRPVPLDQLLTLLANHSGQPAD